MNNILQLLFLLVAIRAQEVKADQPDNRSSLHLLNILPFPDTRPNTGWDRAYELLPAAQLAVDQINNASHILPGYKLNLVNVDAEACGVSLVTKGLINTYANLFTPNISLNVVGFMGLFCSTVTDTITSIFGVPNMTYLQFAGSTAPLHRNSSKYPWVVSSTTIFNDAMVQMVRQFNWTKLSVVFEYNSLPHETTVDDFSEHAKDTQEFNLTTKIPISANENVFIISDSRIVYVAASNDATVELMCSAFGGNALYPGFVYILLEKSVSELLSLANTTDCSRKELEEALEGVFTMSFRLSNEGDHKLVPNMTYQEYHDQYLQYLMEMEFTVNATLRKDNIYANVMYDQIWTFALALGKSINCLQAASITPEKLQLRQTKQYASIQLKSTLCCCCCCCCCCCRSNSVCCVIRLGGIIKLSLLID